MAQVINAIILVGWRLLLVRKRRGPWMLPGGKTIRNETDMACLKRELHEELSLNHDDITISRLYRTFDVRDTYTDEPMRFRAYFVKTAQTGVPSHEIAAVGLFDLFDSEAFSPYTMRIIDSLIDDGYLRAPREFRSIPWDQAIRKLERVSATPEYAIGGRRYEMISDLETILGLLEIALHDLDPESQHGAAGKVIARKREAVRLRINALRRDA